MSTQELLKKLFSELQEKAYEWEYHNYHYKTTNQVIRSFFEEYNLAPSESQSVVDNEESKEDFYCDWKGDGHPECCVYQCEVCRDYEKSD